MVFWFKKPVLQFEILGPLKKDDLRSILIEIAKEIQNIINLNEKITPFLKKSPLTINDIDIGICIVDNKDKWVYHPNIFSASLDRSKLYFHTVVEKNIYKYKTTES